MVHSGEYRDLGQVPPEADVELAASEYVAQVAPEDFGGAWFDRENGHVVLAAATPRGASIITSLRAGATSISAALSKSTAESREMDAKADKGLPALTAGLKSGRIEQRLVTYDSQFLMRVQDRLTQFSSTDGIGEPVWMTRVDVANNRVIVTVDQFTQDLAQEIVTTFGPDVVAVEVASDPVPVVPAAGRWNDTSTGGFYGGARLSLGCTDAFSWYSGSTHMMLTAGHCIPSGGTVATTAESMGSVASGSRENWSTSVGTQYLTGQTTYRGDMALISLSSGKTSAGRIYRGNSESTSSSRVAGMMSRSSQANGTSSARAARPEKPTVAPVRVRSVGGPSMWLGSITNTPRVTGGATSFALRPRRAGAIGQVIRAHRSISSLGATSTPRAFSTARAAVARTITVAPWTNARSTSQTSIRPTMAFPAPSGQADVNGRLAP